MQLKSIITKFSIIAFYKYNILQAKLNEYYLQLDMPTCDKKMDYASLCNPFDFAEGYLNKILLVNSVSHYFHNKFSNIIHISRCRNKTYSCRTIFRRLLQQSVDTEVCFIEGNACILISMLLCYTFQLI